MLHGSTFVQEVAPSAAFDPLVQQAKKTWRLTLAVPSAVWEITETDFLSLLLVMPLVTW